MPDNRQRTLLLTGASRGIGHATVKRFSAAGWRVLTVSRMAFSEDCPWEGGADNHIQLDLADLEAKLDTETAAFILQSPNFFGVIEDVTMTIELETLA